MAFKIVSINARGLNFPQKRPALLKEANSQKADILLVQETHFAADKTPNFTLKNYNQIFLASGPKKKNGVLMVIQDPLQFQIHQSLLNPEGCYLILVCDINQTAYTLANIYGPYKQQLRFCKQFYNKWKHIHKGRVLIGGDFNITGNPDMDTTSTTQHHRPALNPFLQTNNLFDVWRCQHGNEWDFSYFSSSQLSYSHIDFFRADKLTLQDVTESTIVSIRWWCVHKGARAPPLSPALYHQ